MAILSYALILANPAVCKEFDRAEHLFCLMIYLRMRCMK